MKHRFLRSSVSLLLAAGLLFGLLPVLASETFAALVAAVLPGGENAALEELRTMIVSGRAGVATVDTSGVTIGTGTSIFKENRSSDPDSYGQAQTTFEGSTVGSVYDYLTVGPNDEVYLNGVSLRQGVVLYFTLNSGVSLSGAELQIGLHKLDTEALYGFAQDTGGVLYQSGCEDGISKWLPVNTNISSTAEQYYHIDLSACKYDRDKERYELILYADQGMISLTNVKYSGITITATDGAPCTLAYDSKGALVRLEESGVAATWTAVENAEAYPDFVSVSAQMISRTMMLPQQDHGAVITPDEPEDPDDPTEAVTPPETDKPPAPAETIEPAEPTVTAEPTEPTEPTEPGAPTEPTETAESTEPTEPSESVGSSEPTEPSESIEPTETVKPAEPTEPDKPTESHEPTEPEDPIDVPEFTDVKGTWYADTVTALAAKGVIKGYEDGTFRGGDTLTRAEFVTLIVRAFDLTAAKDYQSPFNDVDGWAKEFIDAAASCGIVNGIAGTVFAPNDPITREQMMTIFYRVQCRCGLTLPELEKVPVLRDLDKVSTWAKPAVTALVSTGLIRGDDHNDLLPQSNTTRAEAATVLYRLLTAAEAQRR